ALPGHWRPPRAGRSPAPCRLHSPSGASTRIHTFFAFCAPRAAGILTDARTIRRGGGNDEAGPDGGGGAGADVGGFGRCDQEGRPHPGGGRAAGSEEGGGEEPVPAVRLDRGDD